MTDPDTLATTRRAPAKGRRRPNPCWFAAVLAAATMAGASALAAAGGVPLSFLGVELGTSRAAWRALKPPGALPPHGRRVCSDDRDARSLGFPDPAVRPGDVVCGFVDPHGRLRPPVTFSWRRRYALGDLRYRFRADRLIEIRAELPADAYDAVVADLRASYGPPSSEVRDRAAPELGRGARVTDRWSLRRGRIELAAPIAPGMLSVRFSDALKRPAGHGGARRTSRTKRG